MFYNTVNPIMEGYTQNVGTNGVPQPFDNNTLMGQLFNNATQQTYTANDRYNTLMGDADLYSQGSIDAMGKASGVLDEAKTAGDWWYEQAKAAQQQASDLLSTGEIPAPIMDALKATVYGGLDESMGSSLNDWASRGIVNSSTANKGLSDMSKAAGDALNKGYLDTFSTVLGGYNDTADRSASTGGQIAQNALGVAGGYQDISQGYLDNLNSNLAERDQIQKDLASYYTNAAAPMMPAYDFLQTMQTDHWNSNKQDTIVKQGK